MHVLIVRHADAGDRDEFARTGKPDRDRPLSDKGVAQMRSVGNALVRLVPSVECIITSPYTRALETARLLRKSYRAASIVESDALEPEHRPRDVVKVLRAREEAIVACIGHEPQLGELLGWLTVGDPTSYIDLKKGGAAFVAFDSRPSRGAGRLRWVFGPAQLKALS